MNMKPKRWDFIPAAVAKLSKTPREPTFSFKEIADRLGITPQALVGIMRSHPNGVPVPCFVTRSTIDKNNNKRYHWSDFKRWWKDIHSIKEAA